MRMPAVVVRHHGDGHVTDLRFARQLRFLQVRHADHVRPPAAIDIRLGFRRKLRTFHTNVRAAALGVYPDVLAGAFDHACHLAANGIAKPNMRNQTFAEKCVNAVTGAVEKLIWDYEIERLVFFL